MGTHTHCHYYMSHNAQLHWCRYTSLASVYQYIAHTPATPHLLVLLSPPHYLSIPAAILIPTSPPALLYTALYNLTILSIVYPLGYPVTIGNMIVQAP